MSKSKESATKKESKNSLGAPNWLRKVGGGLMMLVAPVAITAGVAFGVQEAREKPANTPIEIAENIGDAALKTIGFGLAGLTSAYLGIELYQSKRELDKAIMKSEQKPPSQPIESTVPTEPPAHSSTETSQSPAID